MIMHKSSVQKIEYNVHISRICITMMQTSSLYVLSCRAIARNDYILSKKMVDICTIHPSTAWNVYKKNYPFEYLMSGLDQGCSVIKCVEEYLDALSNENIRAVEKEFSYILNYIEVRKNRAYKHKDTDINIYTHTLGDIQNITTMFVIWANDRMYDLFVSEDTEIHVELEKMQ